MIEVRSVHATGHDGRGFGNAIGMADLTRGTRKQVCRHIADKLGRRTIVMIGLMGAGKTTIGRRLAARLDLPFVDADAEIERAAGKSIEDIFNDHGEAEFRDGERRVIARLLEAGPQVLATGGGAFMDLQTRDAIARAGISVWLRASHKVLTDRVARRDHRPLLKTGNAGAIMRALMDERYPFYRKADITVESRDVAHEIIVNDVVGKIAGLL